MLTAVGRDVSGLADGRSACDSRRMKTRAIEEARLRRELTSPPGRGVLAAAVGWSLAWKGASLWRAAQDRSKPWFVALLVTNTLGILDAVYLFGVSRSRRDGER